MSAIVPTAAGGSFGRSGCGSAPSRDAVAVVVLVGVVADAVVVGVHGLGLVEGHVVVQVENAVAVAVLVGVRRVLHLDPIRAAVAADSDFVGHAQLDEPSLGRRIAQQLERQPGSFPGSVPAVAADGHPAARTVQAGRGDGHVELGHAAAEAAVARGEHPRHAALHRGRGGMHRRRQQGEERRQRQPPPSPDPRAAPGHRRQLPSTSMRWT